MNHFFSIPFSKVKCSGKSDISEEKIHEDVEEGGGGGRGLMHTLPTLWVI